MQMRVLSASTMAEDGDKHKKMQMRVLSTRTMAEDGDNYKNNANDKHKNDAK